MGDGYTMATQLLTTMPDIMAAYARCYGLPRVDITDRSVNVARATLIADEYERLAHDPAAVDVVLSYASLALEIQLQYRWLSRHGIIIGRWHRPSEPYTGSAAMLADLARGHLYYLPTSLAADMPSGHPMMARSGIRNADGSTMLLNDVFRAVHDAIGHGIHGWPFGPRGEDNAYRTHRATLSPSSWPALAAETRAQNSWVNYGRHIRRPDGTIPRKGESNYIAPAARPFAAQKAVRLPAWVWED